MKTIEEKAKAYDLAVKRIENEGIIDHMTSSEIKEFLFPDLAESEDEKIRKDVISFVEQAIDAGYGIIDKERKEKWLAWLEKQDEQVTTLPKWRYKKDNTPLLKDSLILNKYGCVAKSPSGALVSDVWVIDYDELAKLPKEEFEKKCEQKPADNVEPKFKVGDKIKLAKEPKYPAREIVSIQNDSYYFDKFVHLPFIHQDEWELVEHKHTDKVEPKFKVGDWVVDRRGNVNRVKEVDTLDDTTYGYTLDNDAYFSGSWADDWHLWTIKDAKEGDVLAYDNGNICIFDGTVEEGIYPFAHCGITRYGFETCDRRVPFTHDNNVHPATKEQRELLFSKMKEVDYEWDAEKNALKAIEKKPTDLPKDEDYGIDGLGNAITILEKTLGEVDGYQTDDGILEHKCAISAVKELYERKSAWSEEDELRMNTVCELLDGLDLQQNWIKSFKYRVLPQSTWKPNDEQLDILFKYVEQNNYDGSVLTSLYDDLKKLKGE